MASVEEVRRDDGTTGYKVRYRDAEGRNKSGGTYDTKERADFIVKDIKHAKERGEVWERPAGACPRFSEVRESYWKWAVTRRRATTLDGYAFAFDAYTSWRHGNRKGELYVDRITLESIEEFYAAQIEAGLAPYTAYMRCRAVHYIIGWAAARETWSGTVRPLGKLSLPASEPLGDVIAPTWEESDRAVANAGSWYRRLALFLRGCPLRVTQAMHLRWEHVDVDDASIQIPRNLPGSKSKHERRGRYQPIPRWLADEMGTWGRREGWLIDRTFQAKRSPRVKPDFRHVSVKIVQSWWAGVRDDVQPTHAFRKTHRTEALLAGTSEYLADFLQGRTAGTVGGEAYTEWRRMEPVLRPIVELVPAPDLTRAPVVVLDAARG